MEDTKIIDLYLARDEDAISQTARKYGKRLSCISYGITADRQSAEECENDTYTEAWNTIPPNEPRDRLYPYLARIIRHISLNLCRRRDTLKRSAVICELDAEMEACIPSPDDTECRLNDIVFAEAINTFLDRLDSQKRRIFIRRYWYLDSIENIAERFSLSESNVKTTLFRCREKLKKHLIKEGYIL